MNNKKRTELARWAMKKTLASGADEAALNIYEGRNVSVKYRDGKLEELKESVRSSLSVTVYAKNRYSSNSTNDLRKESLAGFIEESVAMTKLLGEDVHRRLPDPKYYEDRAKRDLKLYDPAYETLRPKDRKAAARAAQETAAAQSPKIISSTGEFKDVSGDSVKLHSNGFEGVQRDTYFVVGASVSVDDGKGGRPEDWSYAVTRGRDKLPTPEFIGEDAAARALRKIGQRKIKSGKFDMVVENRTARGLLAHVTRVMSARMLQQRTSYLEGMLGKRIASRKLTVIDDPFIPAGMGSRLYDGEGLSAKRRVLIDKGKLKGYLVDNYYGRKLGMELTGGGTSNILLAGGKGSLDDLLRRMGDGILVTGFLGGNANSTTGDFSFGIIGMQIKDGKPVRPINEMNISGDMIGLWKSLKRVGGDPFLYSSWRMPSLHFKKVQFSGV